MVSTESPVKGHSSLPIGCGTSSGEIWSGASLHQTAATAVRRRPARPARPDAGPSAMIERHASTFEAASDLLTMMITRVATSDPKIDGNAFTRARKAVLSDPTGKPLGTTVRPELSLAR